ncbi:hypothetical protein V5O48_018399 [Marasmius crinis-equi]|uniref:C2H2-type domain-containing protein n=1 Tax=Marasmius crinis-equi TaxID=585013 RepID=A0ABR3EL94_9AGAR
MVVTVNEHVDGVSPPIPEGDNTLARERRHACSMCHKRFDRPSTLKKVRRSSALETQMLKQNSFLSTCSFTPGKKCDTCGRRFGVASNLNRHVRRCILKPVNALNGTPSPSAEDRGRTDSRSPVDSANKPRTKSVNTNKSPTQKRRRRAPSPSRWIPSSLLNFNLEFPQKTVSIPLPPVSPSDWEERNSYDENFGTAPYHPREWQYKPWLPGPGLASAFGFGGRGISMKGLGGGPGQMLGLLVF